MCHLLWDLTFYKLNSVPSWSLNTYCAGITYFISSQTEGRIVAFPCSFSLQCYVWNIIAEQIFEANWIGFYNRMWNMNLIKAKMYVCVRTGVEAHKNRNGSHYWDPLKPRGKIWSVNYIKIEQERAVHRVFNSDLRQWESVSWLNQWM